MTDYLATIADTLDREPEHIGRIEERESITMDGRSAYRPRCSCRWLGWAVMDRENARRQLGRHLTTDAARPRPTGSGGEERGRCR